MNFQNSLILYSLKTALFVLSLIMMVYSHLKNIEFIQHVHCVMILRLICSNCLLRDDFDYISFSSRLEIFKLILRFTVIALNILVQELVFLDDSSNKVSWSKNVFLHVLNLSTIVIVIIKDEIEENLKESIMVVIIHSLGIGIVFFLAYHLVQVKIILINNYTKFHDFSNEINKTFNSIEAAMIQFEDGGIKFINNNIIRLLHNTLPNDIEIKLLNIGLQSGYKDMDNLD